MPFFGFYVGQVLGFLLHPFLFGPVLALAAILRRRGLAWRLGVGAAWGAAYGAAIALYAERSLAPTMLATSTASVVWMLAIWPALGWLDQINAAREPREVRAPKSQQK